MPQRKSTLVRASVYSNKSFRCPLKETLVFWLTTERPSRSEFADTLADLSFRWAEVSEGRFFVVAQALSHCEHFCGDQRTLPEYSVLKVPYYWKIDILISKKGLIHWYMVLCSHKMWHLTACKISLSLSFLNWIKNEMIFIVSLN